MQELKRKDQTREVIRMKNFVVNRIELKKGEYSAITKSILEADISPEARLIIQYAIQQSVTTLKWELNQKDIADKLHISKDKVTRSINELKNKGYINVKTKHNQKGQFQGFEYHIFEDPTINPEQQKPDTGKHGSGNKDIKYNNSNDLIPFHQIRKNQNLENTDKERIYNKEEKNIIIPDLQKNISDVPEKINNNNLGKFDLDEKLTELFTPDENNWSLFKRSDITRWKNLWSGDYKNLSEIVEAIPFFLEESKDEALGRDAYNFQSSLGYIKNVLDRKWNFPKWFRTPEQKRQEKSKNVFLKNKESEKEIENKLHEIAIKEGAGLAGKAGFVSIIHELSESCINQVLSIISINQVKEYVREVLTDSKYQLVCKMDKNLKSLKSKDLNILLAEVENIFNISEKAGV
jgi:Trp operon repressor